jgi:hypothetical protein
MSGGVEGRDDDARGMQSEMTAALESLFLSDDRWNQAPAAGLTLIQRSWDDGTVDTLTLLSPETAYAVREAPDGRRPWSVTGSAKHVVDAACEVAAPGAPNASESGLPMGEWR